jgi:hypothetical protein
MQGREKRSRVRSPPGTSEGDIRQFFIDKLKQQVKEHVVAETGYEFYDLENVQQFEIQFEDQLRLIGFNLDDLSSETDDGLEETLKELDGIYGQYDMFMRKSDFMLAIRQTREEIPETERVLEKELTIIQTELGKLWNNESDIIGEFVERGTVYRKDMERALTETMNMLMFTKGRFRRLKYDMARMERIIRKNIGPVATPAAYKMPQFRNDNKRII